MHLSLSSPCSLVPRPVTSQPTTRILPCVQCLTSGMLNQSTGTPFSLLLAASPDAATPLWSSCSWAVQPTRDPSPWVLQRPKPIPQPQMPSAKLQSAYQARACGSTLRPSQHGTGLGRCWAAIRLDATSPPLITASGFRPLAGPRAAIPGGCFCRHMCQGHCQHIRPGAARAGGLAFPHHSTLSTCYIHLLILQSTWLLTWCRS